MNWFRSSSILFITSFLLSTSLTCASFSSCDAEKCDETVNVKTVKTETESVSEEPKTENVELPADAQVDAAKPEVVQEQEKELLLAKNEQKPVVEETPKIDIEDPVIDDDDDDEDFEFDEEEFRNSLAAFAEMFKDESSADNSTKSLTV